MSYPSPALNILKTMRKIAKNAEPKEILEETTTGTVGMEVGELDGRAVGCVEGKGV